MRIQVMASILASAARIVTATVILLGTSTAMAQEQMTDQQSAEKYFDRLDQKKLGFFTVVDMQRIEGKVFNRTDDNKDGQLTLSEYNYGIPDERQDVIDRFTKRFRLADADTNGRVTMEEYMQFCANVVAAADVNKDGMVTKEEFVAASAGAGAE
jgi:Ca2+-binding EF-hand superfamily protein